MLSFSDLREFADDHAPTRMWIDTIKEEIISGLARDVARTGKHPNSVIPRGRLFLMRAVIEDLMVCGAAAIEGNTIIDIGTIYLLVNENGKTPTPPSPAYMQTVKGGDPIYLAADRITFLRLNDGGIYPHSPIEKLQQIKEMVRLLFFADRISEER